MRSVAASDRLPGDCGRGADGERFDVVLAMEVVSTSPMWSFRAPLLRMVKPGGLMVAATLNRTVKSFALAIVGAGPAGLAAPWHPSMGQVRHPR
jgi:2-polyprenyl-3-methyl-5-hydroxy-6-metoxy-1,4-benzoquinol methylase